MKNLENISQELFEKIERYLDQSMPAEESVTFEAEMQNDLLLQKKVADVQQLLQNIETAALSEKLDDFHKQMEIKSKTSKKIIRIPRVVYWAAACAAAVLVIVFFTQNTKSSPERLFAKHFSPDPGLPTTMSSTKQYDFYDGMVNYKLEEYQIALKKWEPLLKQHPKNDTLNYFVGVAYLALGNSEKALPYLNTVLNETTGIFKEDAVHYKIMALLKEGKNTEAIKLLQTHPSDKNNKILLELKE